MYAGRRAVAPGHGQDAVGDEQAVAGGVLGDGPQARVEVAGRPGLDVVGEPAAGDGPQRAVAGGAVGQFGEQAGTHGRTR
ncbi:hypothetical protein [Dactylosporangium sp. NPDC048998]|uniref:hypothetical protein n=1 Tax=Dactylosporangium sp. NPDC048998 TaxID=3363976 RepID=UPI00370FF1DD